MVLCFQGGKGNRMKYVNAKKVIPEELLEQIMEYVDGQYLYIPRKDSNVKSWGQKSEYRQEIKLRNDNIYERYLIGMDYKDIAKMYCLSEKSIRRIVLNKRKEMESKKMIVTEILNEYGISGEPIQIYTSAWKIEDKYVLKEYTDINELQRNIDIISGLYEEKIPVPEIFKTKFGSMYVAKGNSYWILTSKLKGRNIVDVNQFNKEWFFEMGQIIARLHLAFDKCENRINYWNNSLLGEMEGWVRKNISESDEAYVKIDELDYVIEELRTVDNKLPRGIIHRDVHLGNFLFEDNKFSGYIDFDLSQKNIRIFDLCYFMLGLLLEEENRVDENNWFEFLSSLVKGYSNLITLSEEEKKSIATVMQCIELLFVAYFIGENDDKAARDSAKLYEFCKKNRDKIHRYSCK